MVTIGRELTPHRKERRGDGDYWQRINTTQERKKRGW